MRRLAKHAALVVLAIVTLAAFAPLASVILSSWIAEAFGCRLDEGGVYPCVAFGHDIGHQLYTMAVLGWLMLFTAPVMVLSVVIWIVVGLIALRRWAWRSDGPRPQP